MQAGNTSSVTPDFPSDHFNHVFLSIPNETDTLWVECTNSHSPCGFIGDFTDDRYVLVVKENESEIVKTPSYSSEENQQILEGIVKIGSQGDAIANVSYNYKGAQYPDQFALTLLDEKDRKKRITQSISVPNFELDSFNIKVKFDRKPELQKDLHIYLFNFVSMMGERMLFKLNTLNNQTYIPPYARGRKTPLYIRRNYSEKDSIQYIIQDNMVIEAIPDPVEIHSSFGVYKSYSQIHENSIYYHRYLVINKGTYPKEQYNEFRDFLEKVAKADASSAIIKPKS